MPKLLFMAKKGAVVLKYMLTGFVSGVTCQSCCMKVIKIIFKKSKLVVIKAYISFALVAKVLRFRILPMLRK